MREVFSNVNDIYLLLIPLFLSPPPPPMRLYYKLVPGQNREYECGLLAKKLVLRFPANHSQYACFFVQSEAKKKQSQLALRT